MKSYIVQPDRTHPWRTKPGHRILVMNGGAVRFGFPEDWIPGCDGNYVQLIDRKPPDETCILLVSSRQLSPHMTAIPVSELLREVTLSDNESRPITCHGPIHRIFRPPLETAWRQMSFDDPIRQREARTRVCIARGGCTMATIVFDFWPEDELRHYAAWTTVVETLAVGEYIEDPVTGRRREQRG